MSKKNDTFRLGNLPDELIERGHEVWLAGLGVVATVEEKGTEFIQTLDKESTDLLKNLQKEANDIFQTLVERGEKIQKKGQKQLGAVKDDLESTQKEVTKKFEDTLAEVVEKVMGKLDLPTRTEVQRLTKKVQKLTGHVDKLSMVLEEKAKVVKRTAFMVVPLDEGWGVLKETVKEPLSVFPTKVLAVEEAREVAHKAAPSELTILKKDGTLHEVVPFG